MKGLKNTIKCNLGASVIAVISLAPLFCNSLSAAEKPKELGGKVAKNSWASLDEWNREKPGYEWLFAFMDKNRDGQVDPTEYEALQKYKKKHGNAWEGQAKKELKETK